MRVNIFVSLVRLSWSLKKNHGKDTKMSIKTEVRQAENNMLGYLEGGIEAYKKDLQYIMLCALENLYGGGKDHPECNEENHDAIIKVWDCAVENCIKKVMEI
jgi:hypothetical protein